MPNYSRIIDVTRKPSMCPVCGERPVDIIYGTEDMAEAYTTIGSISRG